MINKMSQKTIVTARDIINNEHVFIQCSDFKQAWNTAGKLHILGENHYTQVRLRASKPSLRSYRWIELVKWIGA